MPTMNVAEVAATQYVYCDYPDDGSGHVCPRKPCMPHELLSLKKNGKTVNCCMPCWVHCESSASQVKQQFEAFGGYDPNVDPKIYEHNDSKKLFKLLCRKVHAKEAHKMVSTPGSSKIAMEIVCKEKYTTLMKVLPDGVGKEVLEEMGLGGYMRAVKNMTKTGNSDPRRLARRGQNSG